MAKILAKILHRAPVALFFLLAVIPAIFTGFDGPTYGRDPAPLPPVLFPNKLTPSAFRQVSAWFDVHLGWRNLLVRLGADLTIRFLSINKSVIIGRDGWLFYTDETGKPAAPMLDARGRLRFQPGEISRIDTNLREVGAELAACGKSAFVVVAPNKQSIYREYLIDDGAAPPSRLDDLLARLSPTARAMIIDLRPGLRAAKSAQRQPLYFKADSHWNALGAFYAAQATLAAIRGAADSGAPAIDRFEVRTTASPGGDLAVGMLFSPWRFPDEVLQLVPKSADPAIPGVVAGDGHVVYRNPDGHGRVALIGDSFALGLAPFLAPHFGELQFFRPSVETLGFDGAFTARANAELTLLEVVERNLDDLLRMPQRMDLACAH